MSSEKEITQISKFLSLVLRHKPETIGLRLDECGWVYTQELIEKINSQGFNLTPELLRNIVDTNNKKRFAFNEDQTKIRASQGHSIEVELNLKPVAPPAVLFHGTAEKNVEPILATGIKKGQRQHVHLSATKDTATAVGQRHGKPRLFIIDAAAMHATGFQFYLSDNQVWLTDEVPVDFIKLV